MPRSDIAVPRQLVRDFETCLSFAGGSSSTYVTYTDSSSLDLTNTFTLSAWIKPTSLGTSNAGRIIAKEGGTGQSYDFLLGPNNTFRVFLDNTLYASNSNVITLGVWQHIAVTFDKDAGGSAEIKFYVNGIAAGTANRSTAITANSANLLIGSNSTVSRTFDGKIDEVKIYNRALTATEIANEYYGSNTSTSGLVLYTKFDEGSGTAAIDSSGTQANGTITGATYSTDVVPFSGIRTAAGSRQLVRGLIFNGSTSYVNVGTMGNVGSNLGSGFYASFQIIANGSAVCSVFGAQNSGSGMAVSFKLNADEAAANTPKKWNLILRDALGNKLEGKATNAYNYNDGAIHTFTISWVSGTTFSVTIDGVSQEVTYTSTGTLSSYANFAVPMVFGARNNNGTINQFFNGTIFNLQMGTSPSSLYGSYNLHEGTGTTAADSSGQGNTGTLSGSPLPTWITRTAA